MPSNQIRWCAYEKEDKHERSDQDRSAGNIMYRNWYDQPGVFAGSNLIDLARSVSFLLIVSVGVTYVLLGASLDMSIGSVMGLGGAICGLCLVNSLPVWFSILMGLLASAVVGIVNAVLIVNCRIPALIATLGTMYVARGIVNVLTKGEPYYPLPDEFKVLGQGTLAGIPYSVLLQLLLY